MSVPKKAKVVQHSFLTPSVVWLDLEMIEPQTVEYEAGQFLIAHTISPDGKTVKRSYSIASVPSQNRLSLCVKIVGPSSTHLSRLKPGDELSFSGPWGKGKFTWPAAPMENEIVMLATGTGYSPIRAHLLSALPRHPEKKFYFLWGLRHEGDIFGVEELANLAAAHPHFRWEITLSQPSSGWTGKRGRISQRIAEDFSSYAGKEYFLSGNGKMIEEVENFLQAEGVAGQRLHHEIYFLPLPEGAKA